MSAARLLRQARRRARLSQRGSAARAGVPQPAIARIEAHHAWPGARTTRSASSKDRVVSRGRAWVIMAVLALGAALVVAQAPVVAQVEDVAVREIPVASQGFHARMSPDGSVVAVFDDATLLDWEVDDERLPIRLIDLATGEETASLEGFTDYAADAAFSPDGSRLASWHGNGELLIWDLSRPEPSRTTTMRTGALGNARISFLPDGRTLVALVGGTPSWFHLIDMDPGAVTAIIGPRFASYADFLAQVRPGPAFDLQFIAMAVSPDGSTLAAATMNDEVIVWRIPDGEPRTLRPASERPGGANIRQVAFIGDADSLWYFDRSDGQTHAWDVAASTESALGAGGEPFAVFADSAQLAWVEPTEDERASVGLVDLGGSVAPFSLAVLDGTPAPGVTSIAYTPDGSSIVVGGLIGAEEDNALHVIPAPW